MAREHYKDFNFRADTLVLIEEMNRIIRDYQQQGFVLTVRQLYYQLVAAAKIENTEQSYKRITSVCNDARLAGLMDWDAIEDRTREFITRSSWENPQELMHICARTFHMDLWENQPERVFVIVEKEALVGVLQRTCHSYDVPLLAARGYPSRTVVREFCERMVIPAMDAGQSVTILHLGDHDPSGIDMSRDLEEGVNMFCRSDERGDYVQFDRIALNMDQINAQKPPPNPAKSTDSRFKDYAKKFGTKSWELDALRPQYLNNLVENHIELSIDGERWEERKQQIEYGKSEFNRLRDQIVFPKPETVEDE
jgi:DNA topoisomerase VI subunit A